MKPTAGKVFVEKVDNKQIKKFEVIDNSEAQYRVTEVGPDVVACKKGDFVLFTEYHTHRFNGQEIIRVDESNIDGVKTNSEIKK